MGKKEETSYQQRYDDCVYNKPVPGQLSEKLKSLLAFIFFGTCNLLAATLVVFGAKRTPLGDVKPLPDLIHELIPLPDTNLEKVSAYFIYSEYCFIILLGCTVTLCILHRYGAVILRRGLVQIGFLFLFRTICAYVTNLPPPRFGTICPIRDGIFTTTEGINRMLSTGGMSAMGLKTCGDYVFSGHTIVITVLNLTLQRYLPANFRFTRSFFWLLHIVGAVLVVASREHYTLDVIIAFYISKSVCTSYFSRIDALQNQPEPVSFDVMGSLFSFFETRNSPGEVPCVYENPINRLRGCEKMKKV